MNKEIKTTSNYSELGSKSNGETNLMNKENKEKKPKYYYDWLEAYCIYTNTGCLSQKELSGLEDPKNVNKPMKKKQKKIKKVFLSNGEEVELLTTYQDGNKTEYVVKTIVGENCYEDDCQLVYENRIVLNVYENFNDIPLYLRKTELENNVEKLKKEIKELKEEKNKLTKELKSVYNPKYLIGTPIFCSFYGGEIEELKIIRIEFTEQENKSFYRYCCNGEYRGFSEIGDGYYLTKKEAEEAQRKYIQEEKEKKKKQIVENYRKAKEEYKKLLDAPLNSNQNSNKPNEKRKENNT